ncbi:MAG TPA: type II CAAX endopeptidase family protein [Rhizomicrobium sp.]|jgi:membrane protease YdiL (CAAX protease family)
MSEIAVRREGGWVPVSLRAIVTGLVVGMVAANVWPLLLLRLGMPLAAALEALFLILYVLWAAGGGPPRAWQAARADAFRVRRLSIADWGWGLLAALAFASTIHAAIVVLFRLVPFPAAAFHAGYDFSFIPAGPLQWAAIVASAISAGVCEETGFRGYMQRPIEKRHGAAIGILVSAVFFTLLHLNKGWATIGMVPIVFLAGLLLGRLAIASASLVFCMIGHTIMDIGLFAYWWTQIAGTFSQRPIGETGLDASFFVEAGAFVLALLVTLLATNRLAAVRMRSS